MNMQKVNSELFSQAKALRMCDEVHRFWYGRTLSADELFSLFYANLDFCTDYRWPAKETLKSFFTPDQRHKNGMVVDESWSLLNPVHAIVIGDSKATARYNAFTVGRITVMDNSSCLITVKGHARVCIHLYDKANAHVTVSDNAHATITKHSPDCECLTWGQTTIKDCV